MRISLFILSLAFYVATPSLSALAGDGLLITPHRIVLDGRDREARVTLTNSGSASATYRLFFVNYRMTRKGDFDPVTSPSAVTDAGDRFLDKMIRFSPRQVELPAGETQIVRLMLRLPAALQDGEYRSHLVVQSIPKKELEPRVLQEGKARATITTLYGISIPIILRRGKTSAEARFGEGRLETENDQKALLIPLQRTGNASIYGDVTVTLRQPKQKDIVIGQSNGLAVYPPLPERELRIPLQLPVGAKGQIHVVFHESEDSRKILAERILEVK